MLHIKKYITTHWFAIGIIALVVLAAVLRLYDFPNRWGLGYDQAHDVIVARYALSHFQIPLLGPFSSAGPFQTGGEWYWIVMLGSALFPFWINGPWIFISLLQLLFIVVMVWIGKQLINEKFGLLVGLIAAMSPAEVSQATNLTVTSPLSLTSALAILLMIIFVKNRSNFSIFLFGLFVGLGISIHTQGAALLALVVLTLLFVRPSFIQLVLIATGILIPLTPIFLAESRYGFFNTKGILRYYLHDQYKVPLEVLGRRWLSYLGILWPTAIASAVGGLKPFGYSTVGLWIVTFPFFFRHKKIEKYWIILGTTFIVFVAALRYVHTPLFDSYFMFVHPFMFIFTALSFYILLSYRKTTIIGILILLTVGIGSFVQIGQIIKKSDGRLHDVARSLQNVLLKDYPHKQFSIFDFEYKSATYSLPLVMYLQYYKKIDPSGYRIAVGAPVIGKNKESDISFQKIINNTTGIILLDANSKSASQLSGLHWVQVNPDNVYMSTEEWYTYKK